jgi:hypothetical protein
MDPAHNLKPCSFKIDFILSFHPRVHLWKMPFPSGLSNKMLRFSPSRPTFISSHIHWSYFHPINPPLYFPVTAVSWRSVSICMELEFACSHTGMVTSYGWSESHAERNGNGSSVVLTAISFLAARKGLRRRQPSRLVCF